MSTRQGAKDRGPSLIWLQGLLCGALAAVATPLALLLGVLLAPAAVAAMLEAQPGRPASRSLLLFGLSASVGPVRRLWAQGDTMGSSLGLLSDPRVLVVAWGAAAAAWVLFELAPMGMSLALAGASHARAKRLRTARERLLEEWPGLR